MRRTRRSGGFFLCLLLNLLLNWEGVIPAALLFALHRWRGWPLWWAGLALALWIGDWPIPLGITLVVDRLSALIVWMLVIGWASDCGSRRDEPRENKNPYSAKQYPNSGSAADKKTE